MSSMNFIAEKKRARLIRLLAAAAALLLFPAHAPRRRPEAHHARGAGKRVRINGLSTAELIQQVQSRGVSFQMTADAPRRNYARPARDPKYRGGARELPRRRRAPSRTLGQRQVERAEGPAAL